MSDTFDPYREWLGISAPERPPNYYALLGMDLFENDQEKISNAAMLNMAQVLQFDPGPHCQDARRIFDELEAARACLCNPQLKAAYDARLQARLSGASPKGKKSWGVLRGGSEGASGPRVKSEARIESSLGALSSSRVHEPPKVKRTHRQTTAAHELKPQHAALIVGVLALMTAIVYFAVREPPEYDMVPSLVKQLQHQDDSRRLAAARSLKQLGARASGAIPQMVHLLGSEQNEEVRVALAEALLHAGPGTVSYARSWRPSSSRKRTPACGR